MFEAEGKESLMDYYRFYQLGRKKLRRFSVVIADWLYRFLLLYLIWAFTRIFRNGFFLDFSTLFLSVGFIYSIKIVFSAFFAAWASYRSSQKKASSHTTYEDDRIVFSSSDKTAVSYYNEIVEIVRVKDCIYLFLGENRAIIQPQSSLSGGSFDRFADFISEKCSLPVRSFPRACAYRKE